MKVLLFGAQGMLGTDLAAGAPSSARLATPSLAEVDITNRESVVRTLDRERPDWVINAAAYTAVDLAEAEEATANAVNGAAVAALAEECKARNARLVHYGTDYVFPGSATRPYRESDAVAPVNAYGRSKLLGENGVLASGVEALIIRTQWLFGRAGKSFPRTMWERANKRLPTRVVNDQIGRPTYTVDLAQATWRLMARGERGIFHVTNGGVATWFEFARTIFAAAGAEELLLPCTTAQYPTPAKRPTYSVLDTGRLESTLGSGLPDWPEALERFLGEIAG